MPTEAAGGAQSATISTEHTLTTQTTPGVYVLVVDTANMVNGDVLELRLYVKPRSGSSFRQAYYASYADVQADPAKLSVPVPANVEVKATLKQTVGTGRSFDWALLIL